MDFAILLCFLHTFLQAMADVCPSLNWYPYQTDCYLFVGVRVNWTTARDLCTSQQAHLVRNDNAGIDVFLREVMKMKGIQSVWTGANDIEIESVFVWEDSGAPVNYTDWEVHNPNNYREQDCVRFRAYKSWNDVACDSEYKYACQAHQTNHQVSVTSSATTGKRTSLASDDAEKTTTVGDVEQSTTADDSEQHSTSNDVATGSGDVEHISGSGDLEHTADSGGVEHTTDPGDVEHSTGSGDVEHTSGSGDGNHTSGSGELEHTTYSNDVEHTTDSENVKHTDNSNIVKHTTNSDDAEQTSTSNDVADTSGSISTVSGVDGSTEIDDIGHTVTSGQDNSTESGDEQHSTEAPSGRLCTCCISYNSTHLTSDKKQQILTQLRAELFVPKENTSAYRRKLISVNDFRSSSVAMGSLGCVLLSLVLGFFVVLDCVDLCRFLCGLSARKMA